MWCPGEVRTVVLRLGLPSPLSPYRALFLPAQTEQFGGAPRVRRAIAASWAREHAKKVRTLLL
jgi:hypothetical protein